MIKKYMICGKTGHIFEGTKKQLEDWMYQIGGVFYHFDHSPTTEEVIKVTRNYWRCG